MRIGLFVEVKAFGGDLPKTMNLLSFAKYSGLYKRAQPFRIRYLIFTIHMVIVVLMFGHDQYALIDEKRG